METLEVSPWQRMQYPLLTEVSPGQDSLKPFPDDVCTVCHGHVTNSIWEIHPRCTKCGHIQEKIPHWIMRLPWFYRFGPNSKEDHTKIWVIIKDALYCYLMTPFFLTVGMAYVVFVKFFFHINHREDGLSVLKLIFFRPVFIALVLLPFCPVFVWWTMFAHFLDLTCEHSYTPGWWKSLKKSEIARMFIFPVVPLFVIFYLAQSQLTLIVTSKKHKKLCKSSLILWWQALGMWTIMLPDLIAEAVSVELSFLLREEAHKFPTNSQIDDKFFLRTSKRDYTSLSV
mmetsp:Transcript_23474/g.26642  ORF Transcript_23474/g.26642 Transcript_23474/m.26642 type:complete len:284 (-) Transcript_23474:32-883(-)